MSKRKKKERKSARGDVNVNVIDSLTSLSREMFGAIDAAIGTKQGVNMANQHNDEINHPAHYNKGNIETIDIVDDICQFYPGDEAASISDVLKMIARAPHKDNKIKDLEKAAWFLNHVIKRAKLKELV